MADQLCTTAQVKARAGIVGAGDDPLISELIDQASDWIQDVTGRRLVPEVAATYVVDTSAGSTIYVRRGIRTVTALGIAAADQPDTGGVYTAVALADVFLRPPAIDRKPGWPATAILIRGATTGRLSAALNGAQITGDFGFAATPPVIQGVTIDAVVTAYTNRKLGTGGAIGADDQPIYPWATFFSRGSPQRQTIDRYRGAAGIG